MASPTDNLSFINNEWVSGCGCGGKKRTPVAVPLNSKAINVKKYGIVKGPVTGIEYNTIPNQVSIDIDSRDAAIWLADQTGIEPLPAQKGRLTRVLHDPTTKK